jgi:hypothetical protein
MKKLLVLPVMITLILLVGSVFPPAHAQSPTPSDTPTFYRLVPGTYVNPWPRFTVSYPKEWTEVHSMLEMGEVFRVSAPRTVPDYPSLGVTVFLYPPPLERYGSFLAGAFKKVATDVTIVNDRATHLTDGTPAWEVGFHMVVNGLSRYLSHLVARKGDVVVGTNVSSGSKIGEDLKTALYSLKFSPGNNKPVNVPTDVRELCDRHCNAMVAHDVARLMADHSDRYLNSGVGKGEWERFQRQVVGRVTSCEISITDFVSAGDQAYLAGFIKSYFGKSMLLQTSIIVENGEWKFYGNQREVVP